jgi:hypothetical protein
LILKAICKTLNSSIRELDNWIIGFLMSGTGQLSAVYQPVHMIFKLDKLDYIPGPRKEFLLSKFFLASDKVLAMLGS